MKFTTATRVSDIFQLQKLEKVERLDHRFEFKQTT